VARAVVKVYGLYLGHVLDHPGDGGAYGPAAYQRKPDHEGLMKMGVLKDTGTGSREWAVGTVDECRGIRPRQA